MKRLLIITMLFALTLVGCTKNKGRIVEINNNKYYISDETNTNLIGWINDNNKIYYTDEKGIIQTGWQLIDNNWYYFYGEGIMAYNTTIDGYYLNDKGCWSEELPPSPIEEKIDYVEVKITRSMKYETLSWRYRQNNKNCLEYYCEKYDISGEDVKHYGNYGYNLKDGDIVTAEMFTKIQGDKVLERKLGSIVDK